MRFRYHTLLYRNIILIDSFCDLSFKKVTSPGNGISAFAIDEFDRMWSWGNNDRGTAGQGNPNTIYNNKIFSPRLIYTNDNILKDDWVKVQQGEFSVMGIDSLGQLWATGECYMPYSEVIDQISGNCSTFGLPNNSGDDGFHSFWRFRRAAPDFTCKDFMHNYYYTQMIGNDDKLYGMGWQQGGIYPPGFGMGYDKDLWVYYGIPTLSSYITDSIKLIINDSNFGAIGGVVTLDNRVLACGDDLKYYLPDYNSSIEYIRDITDNLPLSKNITSCMAGFRGILILMDDGTVWGRGNSYQIGNGYYGEDSYFEWIQIPELSNIISIGMSQGSPWSIDSNNKLWTWSSNSIYETGVECENGTDWDHEYPTIATNGKTWLGATMNYYNNAWHAVDVEGKLWAWGSQNWSPQLGIGTGKNASENTYYGISKDPVPYSCIPVESDMPGKWYLTIETTTSNQPFGIEIYAADDGHDFNIDWGDGFGPINYTTRGAKSNTYVTPGVYIVSIWGSLIPRPPWNYASISVGLNSTQSALLKNTSNICGITGITEFSDTFAYCESLTSLPEDLFWNYPDVEDNAFYGTFDSCTGLTSIPENLFKYNTKVKDYGFVVCFLGCSGLTSLPENLFKYNTEAGEEAFLDCFCYCNGLTSLPENLFKYNKKVGWGGFYETFLQCENLTTIPGNLFGTINDQHTRVDSEYIFANLFYRCEKLSSIPENLFDPFAILTSRPFGYTFGSCTALTSIPENLFKNMTELSFGSFEQVFDGCIGITSIPENLFKYNTKADWRAFYGTFAGTGISTIPENLFKYNTEAGYWGFCSTFAHCNGLTSIPVNLFKYNTKVNIGAFYVAFYHCDNLTSIPAGLFDNNTEVSDDGFRSAFGYTNLTSIPAGLFNNNIKVSASGFYRTFENTNITSIPDNLFKYNTEVSANGFYETFSYCDSLASIPAGLFDNNTKVSTNGFYRTFFHCDNLSTIPENLFKYTSIVPSFNRTFESCINLTEIPSGVFDGAINVTSFNETFRGCTNLASIPVGLFNSNIEVAASAFYRTFLGCSSLASIPAGLFDNNTKVSTNGFFETFYQCTNLSSVPEDLFRYNVDCVSWYRCFGLCNKLQLNPWIFYRDGEQATRFAGKSVSFAYCFNITLNSWNGIQGTAPDLWNCAGTFTSTLCFRNHSITSLINYDDIPTAWK